MRRSTFVTVLGSQGEETPLPLTLSGLQIYTDAISTAAAKPWTDESGNGNDITSAGTPTFDTSFTADSALRGIAAGANDMTQAGVSGSGNVYVCAVMKMPAAIKNCMILGNLTVWFHNGIGRLQYLHGGAAVGNQTGISAGDVIVWSAWHNGTTGNLKVNALTPTSTANATAASWSSLTLDDGMSHGAYVAATDIPDTATIESLHDYFSTRWGGLY